MTINDESLRVRVVARRELTPSITEFSLEPLDGRQLPEFSAGAHITAKTPSLAMRRYSLLDSGKAPQHYRIAVKKEPNSRGGSRSMHEKAVVGVELDILAPENNFELGQAPRYLLIAGGIGITPIYAMAAELSREGKDFNIIYCSQSASEAAYLDELRSNYGSRLLVHHDGGKIENVYDFWDDFIDIKNMHIYCCGPKPMMEEIKSISGHWPEGKLNFEDFKPASIIRDEDVAFEVELAKLQKNLTVPADRSILETLRDNGIETRSSCESGTCGTCKTHYLGGQVDHRDMVLMEHEKDTMIMICISRAKEGGLVLDL